MVFTDLPADSLRMPRTVLYVRKGVGTGQGTGAGTGTELEEAGEQSACEVELDATLKHYIKYIKWVNMRRPESSDSMQRLLVEYNDYLQTPLQPLSDNLGRYCTLDIIGCNSVLY